MREPEAPKAAPAEKPDPVDAAVKDIEAHVEQLVKEEAPQETPAAEPGSLYAELKELERTGAPAAEPEEDQTEEPTRRIDFDHLQFGKDYEIK